MATTNYLAGIETNAVELSFAPETTWGVAPSTTFQAIRITGEGLKSQKQRGRPAEIKTTAEASAAITNQITADGAINFALSYGTHDGLWPSLLNSAWSSEYTITSSTTDISFVAATNKLTSTTSGKFTNLVVGQWIRITSPLNAGYGRIKVKTSATDLTLDHIVLVDETSAGTNIVLKTSGFIRNSNTFQSLYFQKKLASDLWLRYPGVQITGATLNAQQGQFAQGSFNTSAKIETKATSDVSTGGITPAPSTIVFNTVSQFQQLMVDGALVQAVCKGVSLQMTKDGAGLDFGVGSASAQGMRIGTFTLAGGKATFFFKDFTLYQMFLDEALHTFSYRQVDAAGNAYIFTCQAVALMNPQIVAQAPNGSVMADFELEGNPSALGTFQIDRIAA
jgi:hypothetical protein